MSYNRSANIHNNEYIDSIVDTIEKEMSCAGMNPNAPDPPDETELLADLLRFMDVDTIEDVIESEF